ncbi:AsmA family protein [Limoniibacter endophyticus]|uniref:Membrane assembly protein AsmA n=1 Tax=Limoniibacter endophyticus TaxID=1565040 RepID=A0A8J3DGH2_9HYPH|nr:AsmA-like C-terminal region-containing protein [Limoniibacter endophyticus]GHC67727.1 membrane assembly protein AsmA [Limoniibacter endophyticus]
MSTKSSLPIRSPWRGLKWGLAALLFIGTAFGLFFVVLPYIASTQIVRDRIALEMSSWSGYRVELGQPAQLKVFPNFNAVLGDVRFSEWQDLDRKPIVTAEKIEITLSPLEALWGGISFTEIRFIRPVLRLRDNGASMPTPPWPGGGRLASAIRNARLAVSRSPQSPDTSSLSSQAFGTLSFSDARILMMRLGETDSELMTGLQGSLSWPALNRQAQLNASGIWRGENVKFSATTAQPLLLFAGGSSQINLSFEAAPLNASYEGQASLAQDGFVNGKASVSGPSIPRMMEWLRTEFDTVQAPGAVSFTGNVSGSSKQIEFQNAELTFNDNTGRGVIEISFPENVVARVIGTLAFQTIDIDALTANFSPLAGGAQGKTDKASPPPLELDLRLSAPSAKIRNLPLTNIAMTVQSRAGLEMIDLSDATAFGGTVQAGLRIETLEGGTRAELRLHSSNLDGAELSDALGVKGLFPDAKGSISTTLRGPATSWSDLLNGAEGNLTARFGAGTLNLVSLPAFVERTRQGGFFALSELQSSAIDISRAEVTASLAFGLARVEKAEILAKDYAVRLNGLVPYVGGGLALSGTATRNLPEGQVPSENDDTAFFVGGSLRSPYISPMYRQPSRATPAESSPSSTGAGEADPAQ